MHRVRPLSDKAGTSTGMQLTDRTAPKIHGSTCTKAHGCGKPAPSNGMQHTTTQALQEANTGQQAGVQHMCAGSAPTLQQVDMSAYTDSRSERLKSRWSTVDSFRSNQLRMQSAGIQQEKGLRCNTHCY